jgi:hypothetical protein
LSKGGQTLPNAVGVVVVAHNREGNQTLIKYKVALMNALHQCVGVGVY